MHTDRHALFEALWEQYQAVTPSAERIHALLGARESRPVVNDHIALRTFNLEPVGLDRLAAHFVALGYEARGEYHFEKKKLFARHFEHPDADAPKVFISELRVEDCSPFLRETVEELVRSVDPQRVEADDFLYSGRHWDLDYDTYCRLLEESEYAAWTAAWGYRANHFTVSINHLESIDSVAGINRLLKDNGFTINPYGGEIKGSPEQLLEQSSTMADLVAVAFRDREALIPGCFYEFARRWPGADGRLYQGFVAASADRIFESTRAG